MGKINRIEKKLPDVELLKLNEAYHKVMYWFFSFPDSAIGLNNLSSALEISKTTTKKIIADFEKNGFLIKSIYGKTWVVQCNRKHYFNNTKKIVFNLDMIFEAYYGGLRDHILSIVGNAHAIILFGSYRKGDDNEKSDIDIGVEVAGTKDLKILQLGRVPIFGYRKDVAVNLHIFSRNKIDINLFSNIANGIVLEGFLEVKT